MKKLLLLLLAVCFVPGVVWANGYDYTVDFTESLSWGCYSPETFNNRENFPYGMSFSFVDENGAPSTSADYFYRPKDLELEYDGILPVIDTDPGEGYSWGYSSSVTRLTFGDGPVIAFGIDMGDKGEDADDIHLRLYNQSDDVIGTRSYTISAGDDFFHTLAYSGDGIAYVDFWGEGVSGNTVYFNNVCFSLESEGSGADLPGDDTPVSTVPIPGSFVMLACGLIGLTGLGRKRGGMGFLS